MRRLYVHDKMKRVVVDRENTGVVKRQDRIGLSEVPGHT